MLIENGKRIFIFSILLLFVSILFCPISYAQESGQYNQQAYYKGFNRDYPLACCFRYRLDCSYRGSNHMAYRLSRVGWKSVNDGIYPPEVGNGTMYDFGVKLYDMQGNLIANITDQKGKEDLLLDPKDILWFNVHSGGTGGYMPNNEGYFSPIVTPIPPEGFTGAFQTLFKDFYINVA